MKKILKIFLPIFVIGILLGTSTAKGDYYVSVGNTFNYDVVRSTWDISLGSNSSSGTGFNFKDTHYPVGTQFSVEVDAVSSSSVDWTMTVGTESKTGQNNPWDTLGVAIMLFFPFFLTGSTSGSWNQTEIDLGPTLATIYFVDPFAFSEMFYQFANETYISESLSETEFTFENVYGTFDNASTIAVFEWHFDTTYSETGDSLGGTYTFKFAFDKNTGQMKGIYFDIDYSGTIDGVSISYKLTQLVEDENYNLPGAGFIPGFEWFITLPVLAILGSIAVIVRKRK